MKGSPDILVADASIKQNVLPPISHDNISCQKYTSIMHNTETEAHNNGDWYENLLSYGILPLENIF